MTNSPHSPHKPHSLESLVPPLDLCKQIPPGNFDNSALVWFVPADSDFPEIGYPSVIIRTPVRGVYPAPTLQEILVKLPDRTSIEFRDSYPQFVTFTPGMNETPASGNGAEAALRLWLALSEKSDQSDPSVNPPEAKK